MGTCTSTVRRRQKQHRQLHKRITSKNSTILDNKQLIPLPITIFPNQKSQRPHSLLTNFNVHSSSLTEPTFHQTETNSLIHLYSSNTNNNNNSNIISYMSSSSSTSHTPPRIQVPKSRLPAHQSQPTVGTTNQTGSTRLMSTTNRAPLAPSPQNTTQPRFGFIPRPTAPGSQHVQASSLAARSRSISPSSTISANSSSSTVSQRLTKTQTIPKPVSNRSTIPSSSATNASKSKITPSSRNNKDSSTTNRISSNTPLRASTGSPLTSAPSIPHTKTNLNTIRDRYKTQTRANFLTRHPPTTNSLPSPSVIKEEKNEQLSTDAQRTSIPTDNQNDDLKTNSSDQPSSSHSYSTYGTRNRQQAANTLSSSSLLSDVLNQDALLDDGNCSLKSEDLLCDYDDTLTLDSASKNDPTDSCSSSSFSIETNKNPTMITPVTTTKPNIPPFQPALKEHRSATIAKCSTADKTNGSLRESLDELTQLSHRMDNIVDNEHNRRLLTRSVSLKPPPTSLPPREDAEQITMDIESYRQVMKDVMVVKTILHQLDRLLKHSDGANMTDSMIGSFHDTMTGSRRYSSSGGGDGSILNSIDENSSYDDLAKEVLILRKEREQDKLTIKLLQEQMYKYSSHTNG